MKKNYIFKVNGLDVQASYEEQSIKTIFLPLLQLWTRLQNEKGRRILIFLSAPPGTGKTTFAQFLEYLSGQEASVAEIQSIGLDGFHFHQEYILTHSAVIDGKTVPMKNVKGAPETFDIDKLKAKLKELKQGDVKWPIYDRKLHDVVEDAITVTKSIILIEGNWLLSTEGAWADLISWCDDSIFIYAGESLLKKRLIERKRMGGLSPEEAKAYYESCDSKNVNRLLNHHHPGRIKLAMQPDGNYTLTEKGEES